MNSYAAVDRTQHFSKLQSAIAADRQALLSHPVYSDIDELAKLHAFMQAHVFAVWDFMSLLKAMQRKFCGSDLPWRPPTNPQAARLINEMVLDEESDEDRHGGFGSHFDLYLRAMESCGADQTGIARFLAALDRGDPVHIALDRHTPLHVRRFVRETFDIIGSGNICAVASAFLFGREDLIPDVFQRIVEELNQQSDGRLGDFQYYLQRHIELDGDSHGPMAERLLSSLCGEDASKWRVAEDAAVRALRARKLLWDGIHREMQEAADEAAI